VKPGRSPAESVADSWSEYLDKRPIVVAIAGPNGAGKSTFFEAHLKSSGLRFLNADVVAGELDVDAYEAAQMVAALRVELVRQRESFIFETVFSDPVGDKLAFLKQTAQSGYAVVLCFVGIADSAASEQRVAMRVSQGGHDVPTEKLTARFPRTLANLSAAIRELPCVLVFDNDDLRNPFRHVAVFTNGRTMLLNKPVPVWLRPSIGAASIRAA
jgi:predicted ABC-type ATPase